MRRWLVFTVALLVNLLHFVTAKSAAGDSVLVLLEKDLDKTQYSTFFAGLEDRGFKLTFRDPKAKEPLLVEDDIPQFNHVIFFTPTTKSYAPDITPQTIVSLISSGVNVLFTLSPTQTPLMALASEFSLIPAPPHTPLISHFPERDGLHSLITVPVPKNHPILSSDIPPVLFDGAPHALGLNPLVVPILRAPPESFATDTDSDNGADAVVDSADKGGEGLWAGSQLGLVTGFQTRTGNGRAVFAGGISLFSNTFTKKKDYGNARFVQDIAKWVFQETNVLRIDEAFHRHAGANETAGLPDQYTVNDQVQYTVRVSRWNPDNGEWEPYSGLNDLQLEFTMLDPHIRTALPSETCTGSRCQGKYTKIFRAPDRHGVFKFVLDYKRQGWTFLQSALTVPVVPPRHDGYPRFLSAAWPYYAGAISTSTGFVLFTILWLAGGGAEKELRKGKKTE
ncbi:Dolichyl-diphosphooligosaccharide-protein glycosyltransferase [Fomitiporia mediterranea MF3/22]|uniref:Dolichyl-diphosphooligosaccharide-protein glycosyltransferase n=1 Tax=Fomitiporia mediterranea (strain MF3/22) TaxID=694068 RepID=UPI0004408940|nr:Dolichyl-diphosphooligosaccharide-protein glycosyltransferase [Fomitiporia mediterranea MF3/22]EJD06283.1 Dolichyl-diphosphooligosaccharide-protein glycosyltransferase [Fomitiporia mediterranea MF3/22]